MPTMVSLEVLKMRALFTYAIMKSMTVDVGKMINVQIDATIDSRAKMQSIGFT